MDAAQTDIPAVHPRPGDEDIRQALKDLDARLSAWALAMRELHERVARQAAAEASVPVPPGEQVPDVVEPAKDALAGDADSGRVPDKPPLADEPEAAEPSPDTATLEPPADAVGQDAEPIEQISVPAAEAVAESPDGGPEDTEVAAKQNEDEALLASLDEQTASAIRVMRRLNPTGKSVRELLEHYQATHSKAETARTRRKSWFSRGR